jgi:hypothetical protein
VPYPTAASFRKHNKRAVGKVGKTAAHMATKMEARGVKPGIAIATASKYIAKHSKGLMNRG